MFNLLPQEQKKKIRQLYLRRFAIVTTVGAIFLVLIFCILMLPSFVTSSQKLQSSQDRKEILEKEIAIADNEELQTELAEIKSDIDALQKSDISTVNLIENIIINKGTGVSFYSFSFSTEASGEKKLFIEGTALNRDKLKQFLQKMEEQDFKKVDLPISNFARDKDIPFSITIIISNE